MKFLKFNSLTCASVVLHKSRIDKIIRFIVTTRHDTSDSISRFKILQKKLNLSIAETGISAKEIREICKQIIGHSVKTGHPHFYNQLFGRMDSYGLAGSWITEALNTSQ